MEQPTEAFDPKNLFDFPDPYPMFAMMRATTPVSHVQMMNRESYLVSRYDDAYEVLRDNELFSSRANFEVGKFFGRTLIEMDGKEHTRHRSLVQNMFSAKALDVLAVVCQGLVDELLDDVQKDTRADLVEQFSLRFPVQVIGRVLGIPRAEYPKYQKWALQLVGFSKDPPAGLAASQALHTYLTPIIQAHRAAPTDDVISKLVTGTVDGVGLTDDEVVNFLRLLIPAGAETTSRLIGTMLFALLSERERYERVRADRSLVPWAIEESLRWETPVVFVAREATRTTEIRGVEIPAGKNVSAIIGAGNRDPEKYPDPDTFDLDRHADDHLSFGFGRHFCLGYNLAKLEARTALNAVLDRLPKLRIDPDAPPPSVRGMAFRSPPALPVRFD